MALEIHRGKGKVDIDYGTPDMFKYYKEKGGVASRGQYGKICSMVNDLLLREVIFNNYTIKLPRRLGDISLICLKGNADRMMPDWDRTHKYWLEHYGVSTLEEAKKIKDKKIFYHLNEHTNGKHLWWYWRRGAVKNIRAYSFDVVRPIKRTAAAYVKKLGDMPYYTIFRRELKEE